MLGFLVLGYVPMALTGWYAYHQAKQGYHQQVEENVSGLAHLVLSRFSEAMVNADHQLTTWTKQQDALAAPPVYGQTLTVFRLLQNRFRQFLGDQRQSSALFESIICARALEVPNESRGLVLYASDPGREKTLVLPGLWRFSEGRYSVSPRYTWGAQMPEGPRIVASPFHSGLKVLPIAREFQDASGKPAALVGFVSWRGIQRILEETPAGEVPLKALSQKSQTYVALFDAENHLVGGVLPPGGLRPDKKGRWPWMEAAQSGSGSYQNVPISGIGAAIVGLSRDPISGWTAVVFRAESAALAPLRHSRNAIVLAAGLFLIALLGLSLQVSRRMAAPVQVLVEATKGAAAGTLKPIPIGGKDEFSELGVSFNLMIEKLRNSFMKLASQNEDLSRMNRLRSQFLANTSHELRTPLHGIVGLLSSILDGAYGPMVESQRSVVEMALKSAERLKGLVNSLLDFSSAQKGEQPLQPETVNVEKLLREDLWGVFEGLNREKRLRLSLHVDKGLPTILADREKLRQLFMNLVGNAIKFTRAGSVEIFLRSESNLHILCAVKDTGIGIPAEELTAIFEPFRQGADSSRREFEGTGLGLAIAKGVVERHGGRIWVESTMGEGTTFFVDLPVEPDFVMSSQPKKAPEGLLVPAGPVGEVPLKAEVRSGNGELIWVIDDEPVNVEVLRGRLEMYNYRVLGLNSAVAAIEHLERGESLPDLILLDIMMPKMSGYDFCVRLKANSKWKDLPVIIVSAKTQLVDKVYGLNLGAVDYMVKPFQKEELLSKIRTFLDLRHLTLQLESRVEERTQSLRRANEQLETSLVNLKSAQARLVQSEKLAGLGTMAAGIAHELNNALNYVAGNLPSLRNRVDDLCAAVLRSAEQGTPAADVRILETVLNDTESILAGMAEGVARSQSIITQLVAFGEVGGARKMEELPSADVASLLANVLSVLEPRHHGVMVHRSFSPERLPLRCDPAKLTQVFSNILANAFTAVGESGNIWLTGSSSDSEVRVDIRDDGCGIAPDKLSRVFEPFYTDRPVGSGAGLGLSIAYAFVAEHSGEIEVMSRLGLGSTFSVRLPHVGDDAE